MQKGFVVRRNVRRRASEMKTKGGRETNGEKKEEAATEKESVV